MCQDSETENRDTAIFDVFSVKSFTAKELRDDMGGCMATVRKIAPEGDTDELRTYAGEFLVDVDGAYPSNTRITGTGK